jgi:hypothetical protein
MVYQFNEWSIEMLHKVEEELNYRNILPLDLRQKKQEAIDLEHEELSEGKEASIAGILLGFLTCLGLLGLLIGYNYAYSKARSKYTNKKYFKYNLDARTTGKYMIGIAITIFIIASFYRILNY